jgi:hypothetical protein
MCGITGWVDFGRDLRRQRAASEAMTATMTCRGPDAGGVWCSAHAAIGHRRLSVIDLPGGDDLLLPGRPGDGAGGGVVPVGLAVGAAVRVVAELAEHPGAGSSPRCAPASSCSRATPATPSGSLALPSTLPCSFITSTS